MSGIRGVFFLEFLGFVRGEEYLSLLGLEKITEDIFGMEVSIIGEMVVKI